MCSLSCHVYWDHGKVRALGSGDLDGRDKAYDVPFSDFSFMNLAPIRSILSSSPSIGSCPYLISSICSSKKI